MHQTRQRRKERLLVCLGVLVLLLLWAVACAGAGVGTPVPKAPEGAAATAPGPKYGGVFKLGTVSAPENLNYLKDAGAPSAITFLGTLYEGLLNFDSSMGDFRMDLPISPALAEKWEQPGPTTLIFHIRKGVKFHDGVEMTAEDVLWSLEYARDPKNAILARARIAAIDKVEKVDDYTIRLTLKGVSPTFLADLTTTARNQPFVVLPKHVFDKGGAEALLTQGIGTGPFKLKKFEPTGTTVFVRNEAYWSKDKEGRAQPYMDGVEFTHNMDYSAQEAAFAAQELDAYNFPNKAAYDAFVRTYKEVNTLIFYNHLSFSVYFNLNRKPFDDVRVRRAVHLAIDRQEINETVMQGQGVIGLPVVPAIKKGWGYSQEEMLKLPGYRQPKDQDIAEAKRLLDEAGYPRGFKMVGIYANTWVGAPLFVFLPTQMKKIGIEMELRPQDNATHTREVGEGNYDTAFRLLAHYQPLIPLDQYFHSQAVFAKSAGIKDPEMDRLIEQLRVEMKVEEQKRIVRRLQEIILDKVYAASIGDMPSYNITQKWVMDYVLSYFTEVDTGAASWKVWIDVDKLPAKRRR